MNLKIIGTSHIAQQSLDEIRKAVSEDKPDLIALELDLSRAAALMAEEKNKIKLSDILKIGVKGYFFVKIGQYLQQKMGRMVGVAPGAEMKTALELAQKEKIRIALIDQPIQITLKKFSKSLTWKEKFRFVGDFFSGLFFPKKKMRELGLKDWDLSKVPEKQVIEKLIGQMREHYPNIYRVLVSDRNKYMVQKLKQLQLKHPGQKILVIVGAGHKQGMEELLEKVEKS